MSMELWELIKNLNASDWNQINNRKFKTTHMEIIANNKTSRA